MYKVNNAKMAKEIATEKNLHYGMSAFDGKWYVGSPEELKKAGCADIDRSEGKMSKALEIIKMLEKDGELYVHNSSIFDSPPYYQKDKISKILKDAGFQGVHFEKAYGWPNQPEVVVFKGDEKKAKEVLKLHGDEIHPSVKKFGIIIHNKDWK